MKTISFFFAEEKQFLDQSLEHGRNRHCYGCYRLRDLQQIQKLFLSLVVNIYRVNKK